MAELERPSFVNLFTAYLAAFNEHNLEKVFSFLSPSLIAYYEGRQVAAGHDQLVAAYTSHFNRLTQPVYCLQGPKEVEGADAVDVVLADPDEGYVANVRYLYRYEEGQWLHIRHEISGRRKLEEVLSTEAAD